MNDILCVCVCCKHQSITIVVDSLFPISFFFVCLFLSLVIIIIIINELYSEWEKGGCFENKRGEKNSQSDWE